MKKPSDETKNTAALLAAAAVCGLLLLFSKQARAGVSDALTVCGTVILPSLFPLLILSSFAASFPCPRRLQRLCAAPLRRLFGLSPGCLLPLLLGLTCGYPLAAKTARTAREQGLISEEDARRLTLYFTCPGLPFAVTAAGAGCFGSAAVGWTLFASCALADLAAAILFHLTRKKKRAARPPASPAFPEAPPLSPAASFSGGLAAAVERATGAALSVCAWICGFSAFSGALSALFRGKADPLLSLTAEVTTAVRRAAAIKNPPLAAGCLSFGGICVFCQLLPEIGAARAGAARFLAIGWRGPVPCHTAAVRGFCLCRGTRAAAAAARHRAHGHAAGRTVSFRQLRGGLRGAAVPVRGVHGGNGQAGKRRRDKRGFVALIRNAEFGTRNYVNLRVFAIFIARMT